MTRRRLAVLGITLALFAVAVLTVLLDARSRRVLDASALDAFVRRTGSSELALSSTSRWLRHPGLAEPGAACQDQPPCLDTDPGGLAIGPPRATFGRAGAGSLERTDGSER